MFWLHMDKPSKTRGERVHAVPEGVEKKGVDETRKWRMVVLLRP
jgi:hypothetical protein